MIHDDHTQSLCPICLKRIDARRVDFGDQVYLIKKCPDHGFFKALIWDGMPAFQSWKRPKIPTTPSRTQHAVSKGCPFDCGLCPNHRQRSCTIILEVTRRCNLSCSFCYADSGTSGPPDPELEIISRWYQCAAAFGGNCHIQISGGEPTLRDDLPEIVAMSRKHGFSLIQLNTNGLRLARDAGFVKDLKAAGLDSVFLQFDGLSPQICREIRGRDLVNEKLAAIDACGRNDIGVVLVPTLVPGINTGEIGTLIRKAISLSPVVRGIHFQPVSYFGRFPKAPADDDRITLPRLMRAISSQTKGMLKTADFKPPGCENALCSFHANYLLTNSGHVRLLGGGASCCDTTPRPAEEGAARTIASVARQWSGQRNSSPMASQKPSHEESGALISLDDFLAQARPNTFSVSAMAFQDVWNVDLDRVMDCCIHIMTPDGELVPFCAYNLTAADGRGLYR